MDEVKRKVLIDLFASPGTLLPIVAGASSLLFSFAVGGDPTANAIGIVGLLGGAGHFASRLILGLESMTARAYNLMLQRQKDQRNAELNELQSRLANDNDPRTDTALAQLRQLYQTFQDTCHENRWMVKHQGLISQVEDIFQASVLQLERSWDLFTVGRKLTGAAKEKCRQQRELVIQEVLQTRDHLSSTIEQFHALQHSSGSHDLKRMRKELDETLKVAKRTQERMAEMGQSRKAYDESEFQ